MIRGPWKSWLPEPLLESERLAPLRALLLRAYRWLNRHLQGFYSAVGLFLAIGLALALVAVWGFAWLAEAIGEGATHDVDVRVLLWINQYASERMDVLAVEITALGDGAVVVVLVLVSSLLLWLTRNRHLAVILWVASIGGLLINTALKLAFDRPRPQVFEWRIDYAGLSSFPSGHATIAMVVYVALAYVIARLEPTPGLRRVTFAIFGVLVLLIGLSRLYLGVHYPSDVAAGFVVGFAWAVFSALAVEAIRHARTPREPDAPPALTPEETP